jgi:hypothetical protein
MTSMSSMRRAGSYPVARSASRTLLQVVVGASLVLVAQLCESCAETVLALRIETL